MEPKKFYRLANTQTNQGLWYDMDGNFTGLIHTDFKFCLNHELPMPFDAEIVGYLSCTDTLETLYQWFPVEDIKQMEEHGYFITVYESTDYRFYHNHWVFNKVGAKFVERISLSEKFDEWVDNVRCCLFHVEKTDLDGIHGVRIDQLQVIQAISNYPKVLKHRTLKQLFEMFDVLD